MACALNLRGVPSTRVQYIRLLHKVKEKGKMKKLSRRNFLRWSAIGGAGLIASACAPQVIEKTVEVTREVEVEKTVEVERTVEVEVEVEVPVGTEKPDKLVFWHMYFDDDANKGLVIKDFANTFASATDIEVELSQIVWTDHTTRMQTVGASQDKIPDAFVSGVARSGLQAMVDGGFCLPLDDFLTSEDLAQYQASLLDQARFDGKLYALPQESQVFGFLYNMQVFEDLGIEKPTTLDDLEAAMDKILAADILPLPVVVGTGSFAAEWLFQALAARAATQKEMDAITSGEAKFSDTMLVVEETIERWGKKGYYGPSPLTNEWGPMIPAMYEGSAAMMCMGIFFAAESMTQYHEEDLKYGLFSPPPLVDDIPPQISGGLWWNASVNVYSDYPEWATRLAVAMSGKGFSEQWIRRTHNPAGGAVDTEFVTWTTLRRAYEILDDHAATWFNIPPAISSDFVNAQVSVIAGEITGQEAADQIDALFAGL